MAQRSAIQAQDSRFCTFGHPRIVAALGLIHDHPQEPWTAKILAHRVGMPLKRFTATFVALVGKLPSQYLTRVRILKAVSLLEASTLTVTQTARRVGYGSDAAFARAFRRSVGSSPGQYRRKASSRRAAANPPPPWLWRPLGLH